MAYCNWFGREPTQASDKVVTFEWHSQSRPEDYYVTSHSWLEMRLADGTTKRLEFVNGGFIQSPASRPANGEDTLYAGRRVASVTMTGDEVLELCRLSGARKYSTIEFNCHHWALEVWNAAVLVHERCWTYPDQWKAGAISKMGLAKVFDVAPDEDTGVNGRARLSCQSRLSFLSGAIDLFPDSENLAF